MSNQAPLPGGSATEVFVFTRGVVRRSIGGERGVDNPNLVLSDRFSWADSVIDRLGGVKCHLRYPLSLPLKTTNDRATDVSAFKYSAKKFVRRQQQQLFHTGRSWHGAWKVGSVQCEAPA